MTMKYFHTTTILIFLFLLGCKTTSKDFNFIEFAEKVELRSEGSEEFFYWEVQDVPQLWELEVGNFEYLNRYKDTLLISLGKETYDSAIEAESVQNLEKSLLEGENDGDKINALLVHTGSVGKIRKINYLESEILNYQIGRFPMFSHPTEFHAFILKNEKENKVRIYFGASDTEWPPKPTVIIQEIEEEINKGWRLVSHLHNHYCKEDKNYIGILAPSLPDAQYYKWLKEDFNLDVALITNGFHTVEIDKKDFLKFESH